MAAAVVVGRGGGTRGGQRHKLAAVSVGEGTGEARARELFFFCPFPLALSRRDSTSAERPVPGHASCQLVNNGVASDRFRLRIVSGLTSFVNRLAGIRASAAASKRQPSRGCARLDRVPTAIRATSFVDTVAITGAHFVIMRDSLHHHSILEDFAATWECHHTNFPSEKPCFVSLPRTGHVAQAGKGSRSGRCDLPTAREGGASLLFILEDVGFFVVEVFAVFWSMPMLSSTASLRGSGHARR